MRDCFFQANSAGLEGGAISFDESDGIVTDSTFQGNWSTDGGAVFVSEEADCRLTNCRFMGNAVYGSGGAVYAACENLTIVNGLFSGNMAFIDGGAVALVGSPAELSNCTFYFNVAEGRDLGGGALAIFGTTAELTNCILWNESHTELPIIALQGNDNMAELIISYSTFRDDEDEEEITRAGWALITKGHGNINADPRFRNPAGADEVVGTEDDDLSLRAGSSSIDAGDNTAVPADTDDLDLDDDLLERIPLDLAGHARFVDDPDTADTGVADEPAYPKIVDIGAYEYTP